MSVECDVWWSAPLVASRDFLAVLDHVEHDRYQGYRKETDKRRFLTGRVLAKSIVASALGGTPHDIVFDATCADCGKPHGRPHVSGADGDIALSISHSGERIGVAITAGTPVGLDVETASRNSVSQLIDYALSDAERAAIANLTDEQRDNAFFGYWTRKEALMKATGKGLKIPLRGMTLAPPHEPPGLLHSDDAALAGVPVCLIDLDPGAGYRASVAVLTKSTVTVTEHWWTPHTMS